MNVIDLSDWNDHINWSHMIDEGVEGVIVKSAKGAHSLNFTANTSPAHPHVAFRGAFTATPTHRQQHGQKKRQRSSLKHWVLWDTVLRP